MTTFFIIDMKIFVYLNQEQALYFDKIGQKTGKITKEMYSNSKAEEIRIFSAYLRKEIENNLF